MLRIPVLLVPCLLLPIACSPNEYRDAADEEVYGLIEWAQQDTLGETSEFTINPRTDSLRASLASVPNYASVEPVDLDLASVLRLAFENSRDFQTQKEAVYLAGLNLSDGKFRFSKNWFAGHDASASGSVNGDSGRSSFLSDIGVTEALEFGGAIGLSLVNTVSRMFVTADKWSFDSALTATFSLPLMRGAGYEVARNNLTQSEHDMLYAVRTFVRYQQTYSVQIVSQFLGVIQTQNQLHNAEENHKALRLQVERNAELQKAGKMAGFEVDQARQDELTARARVVNAQASLNRSLDSLKLTLGLPTTLGLMIDEADLEKLRAAGTKDFELPEELAIAMAFEHRQDLAVTRQRLEDAERQARVAANALEMGLDFQASWTVPTDPRQGFDFKTDDSTYAVGIGIDLPIQRLLQRNAYRRALINVQVRTRAVQQAEDQIRFDVRNALRNLRQARDNYEIQTSAAGLAERRIENVELLIEAGRATTRDLLESRRALLSAKDAVTSALVDYTLSRLELARDLGVLEVNVPEARLNDAIQEFER